MTVSYHNSEKKQAQADAHRDHAPHAYHTAARAPTDTLSTEDNDAGARRDSAYEHIIPQQRNETGAGRWKTDHAPRAYHPAARAPKDTLSTEDNKEGARRDTHKTTELQIEESYRTLSVTTEKLIGH